MGLSSSSLNTDGRSVTPREHTPERLGIVE